MRAQEAEIRWSILQEMLKKFEDACCRFDYGEMWKLLLQIVPDYTPECGIEDFIWRA